MTRPLLISVRINLAFPEHLEATIYTNSSTDYTDSADFNEQAKELLLQRGFWFLIVIESAKSVESVDNYFTAKTKAATGVTRLRLSNGPGSIDPRQIV